MCKCLDYMLKRYLAILSLITYSYQRNVKTEGGGDLEQEFFHLKWPLTYTYEIYKVNITSKTLNCYVFNINLNFETTDFFRMFQNRREVHHFT